MGLRENTRNINDVLQRQLTEKEKEKLIKEKRRQTFEHIKLYKRDLERFTKNEFKYYFKNASTQYKYQFLSAERKEKILQNFFNTIIEKDANTPGYKIPHMLELRDYYYNSYRKWLDSVYKDCLDNEIYLSTIKAEKIEKEKIKQIKEEEKAEKTKKIFDSIFKILIYILFIPIILILCFIKSFTK